ncbi:Ig-like domain-containing protein [Pseudoalteromonas sp. YIC-656]|uniref:PKD domain-containing protein n=1 Tax=Pseudoalteromonas pernae TaxID=3118054 RepID=UPI00324225D6
MNLSTKITTLLLLVATLSACGEGADSTPSNVNPTVLVEGPSEVNEGTSASIIAKANDTDGQIVSYSWKLLGGETITTEGASTNTLTFIAPDITEDREITFEVTVTDNDGATTTEAHTVTIKFINQAPISIAGNDVNVVQYDTVVLSGSESSDPDGQLLSFIWGIEQAPEDSQIKFEVYDDATLRFEPDVPGEYVITLTVSDGQLESIDTVIVTAERYIPEWVFQVEEDHNIPAETTILHCLDNELLECDYDIQLDSLVMVASVGGQNDTYRFKLSDAIGGTDRSKNHWLEIDTPDTSAFSVMWTNAWIVLNSEEALRISEAPTYFNNYQNSKGEPRLIKRTGLLDTNRQVYDLVSETINGANFQFESDGELTLLDPLSRTASKGLDSLMKMKKAQIEHYVPESISPQTIGQIAESLGIPRGTVERYCADTSLRMLNCFVDDVGLSVIELNTLGKNGNTSIEYSRGSISWMLSDAGAWKSFGMTVLLREKIYDLEEVTSAIKIVNERDEVCHNSEASGLWHYKDWDSTVTQLSFNSEVFPSKDALSTCMADSTQLFVAVEVNSEEHKLEILDYKASFNAFKALWDASNI